MPEWCKKLIEWLVKWWQKAEGVFSGLGIAYQVMAYLVLAAVCGLIIVLVIKAIGHYQRRLDGGRGARPAFEEGEADLPPGDIPVDVYVERAQELSRRGLYREAIGQLLLGAMSYTERSGLIRFRRGLTHRDYLRALRGKNGAQQAFHSLVGVYEPICFGRRPVAQEHFATSLDHYQSGFQNA